ncbi:DUF6382 domain-containing protein [Paenibacillus sp. MCAF9]|uniref:DUF6382 domain-containing protein n=1 Tax=Paenibacillus sp. MCAF9 TaxID=3233046 RepID=UPI003F963B76
MKSFRIDFAMNQSHEMIIDRESGLYRSELDEIELHMLHSERIPYLLPIDWFELDSKVTFRYKLSGMRMLLHRLQQQQLSMEQYYTLILGVADALFECRHYMLRPEGCLLDEQYIFIGEKLHDIRLAYIPIMEGTAEQTKGAGDLLALIVRFTSYVDRIDGEGLKRVLQHFGKRWPLEELRATLLELIGEASSSSNQRYDAIEKPETQQAAKPAPTQKNPLLDWQQRSELKNSDEKGRVQIPNPSLLSYSSPIMEEFKDHELYSKQYADPLDREEDEPETKKKWIGTAIIVVALACVWRFVYFEAAGRQSLLISSGISLLLLAVVMLVWKKKTNDEADYDESKKMIEESSFHSGLFPGLNRAHANDDSVEAPAIKPPEDQSELFESQSAASLHVVAANPVSHIAEPTVLLGNNQSLEGLSEASVWLQRRWKSQENRIELQEGSFKIGRSGEQVSYAEGASGISRLHLEIEILAGEYKAKDLGSRNGSLLNGQMMIPYKSYKLSIGDVIHLAGEQGPAYMLKSE